MNLDNEHMDIEQLLVGQPLRTPGSSLDRRVESALRDADDHASTPWILKWRSPLIWAAGSALAASLALAVMVSVPPSGGIDSSGANPVAHFGAGHGDSRSEGNRPIEIAETWTQYEAAGDVILLDNSNPILPIRKQVVERKQWIDPDDNYRIEMTVPRDEIRFVTMSVD